MPNPLCGLACGPISQLTPGNCPHNYHRVVGVASRMKKGFGVRAPVKTGDSTWSGDRISNTYKKGGFGCCDHILAEVATIVNLLIAVYSVLRPQKHYRSRRYLPKFRNFRCAFARSDPSHVLQLAHSIRIAGELSKPIHA